MKFVIFRTFLIVFCLILSGPAYADDAVWPLDKVRVIWITLPDDQTLVVYKSGKVVYSKSKERRPDASWVLHGGAFDFTKIYQTLRGDLQPHSDHLPAVTFYSDTDGKIYSVSDAVYVNTLFRKFFDLEGAVLEKDYVEVKSVDAGPLAGLQEIRLEKPEGQNLSLLPSGKVIYAKEKYANERDVLVTGDAILDFASVYEALRFDLQPDALAIPVDKARVVFKRLDDGVSITVNALTSNTDYIDGLFDVVDAQDKVSGREILEREILAEYPSVSIPPLGETEGIEVLLHDGRNITVLPTGKAVYKHMQSSIPIKGRISKPGAFDFAALYKELILDIRPVTRLDRRDPTVFFYHNGSGTGLSTPRTDVVEKLFQDFEALSDKVYECESDGPLTCQD
jgi:hypothetical protein